jgi:hypothetical protein
MGDRDKERIKLQSAAIDRFSTVWITFGFVAPVFDWIRTGKPPIDPGLLAIAVVVGLLVHYTALWLLGRLPNE